MIPPKFYDKETKTKNILLIKNNFNKINLDSRILLLKII